MQNQETDRLKMQKARTCLSGEACCGGLLGCGFSPFWRGFEKFEEEYWRERSVGLCYILGHGRLTGRVKSAKAAENGSPRLEAILPGHTVALYQCKLL